MSTSKNLLATVATAGLAPWLVAQGLRVRRTTPRLPGASGPLTGLVPGPDPLRLLVLGESTVDGVGADTHEEALTGWLASALADRWGRGISWRVAGRTGANARTVRAELLAGACREPADLVVVALGVNDTIELRSAARYRRDLLALVVDARRVLGPVPVLLAGVPPLGAFPALPQPLRLVLGLRGAALDAAAATLATLPGVTYWPVPREVVDPALFAADGFHPGPSGYRLWAEQLAEIAYGQSPGGRALV
ncbi:SGNH/GDSL hydrolase family protein [Amycolatopsis thermophila]|uniref:Lysophospholipase L1-like esterase n=1 Tax=Amycolatopsis thermophila TaxID=206084 RepID=A0ABU0ERC3_9PSEU|nr:SGNH/GDSL hydrolase family protein [Amycolatopsis thermophila]MDQ0377833.1 lysophospholipase L1-like esterase [Amycolatopsis thermophila]